MKRKQLIALISSAGLLLTSGSGSLAFAEDATEEIFSEYTLEEACFDETIQTFTEGASDEEPETIVDGNGGEEPDETGKTETSPETEEGPAAQPPSKQTEKEATTEGAVRETETASDEKNKETEGLSEEEISEELLSAEDITEEPIEEIWEVETEELGEEETEELLFPEDDEYAGGPGGSGGYYWDESWFISPDFRFTQVDKDYALINDADGTFVYEESDSASRKVGEIPYGGAVCILKELPSGWTYVESGDIRGFVPKETLKDGDAAAALVEAIGEKTLTQGDLLCEKADNEAFTYTKTTSYPVLARKVYAMSLTTTWIYEYPDMTSRFVGDASNGALMYVLKDLHNGWCYIESGDVRGFIPENALLLGDGAKKIATDIGEEDVPLAEQLVEPEENRSIYYTLMSVKSAGSGIGSDICESAVSFVGKLPYVGQAFPPARTVPVLCSRSLPHTAYPFPERPRNRAQTDRRCFRLRRHSRGM